MRIVAEEKKVVLSQKTGKVVYCLYTVWADYVQIVVHYWFQITWQKLYLVK